MAVKKKPHSRKPGATMPDEHCNARLRGDRTGRLCVMRAGWGTDHPGQGRCKRHGGATPIEHGRYSMVTRPRLQELITKFEADEDPLNLEPDLALLRALAASYLEQAGKTPDPSVAAELVEKATRTVERIERIRNANGVSLSEYNRSLFEVGRVIEFFVKDEATLKKIQDGILNIRLSN